MNWVKSLAAVIALLLLNNVAFSQSSYAQFGNLNHASVNVSSAWTKLATTAGAHTFTKASSTSTIEVYVNSRFKVGILSGANGVQFQVRVDNNSPAFSNDGSILTSNTSTFLSMLAVFRNLPAGNHTTSIWAKTPAGTATSVTVDPGGWGGKIIVKETQ